jgi:hypothetical protein
MRIRMLQGVADRAVAKIDADFLVEFADVPADGRLVVDLVRGVAINAQGNKVEAPFTHALQKWFTAELEKVQAHPKKIESADITITVLDTSTKVSCEIAIEGKRFYQEATVRT